VPAVPSCILQPVLYHHTPVEPMPHSHTLRLVLDFLPQDAQTGIRR